MLTALFAPMAGYSGFGIGELSSPIQDIAPKRSPFEHSPIAHTGQVEEQFAIWMESQYGPAWQRWMPERAVNDQYRLFIMRRIVGLN